MTASLKTKDGPGAAFQLRTRANRRCKKPKQFVKIVPEPLFPGICAREGTKADPCIRILQESLYYILPEPPNSRVLKLIRSAAQLVTDPANGVLGEITTTELAEYLLAIDPPLYVKILPKVGRLHVPTFPRKHLIQLVEALIIVVHSLEHRIGDEILRLAPNGCHRHPNERPTMTSFMVPPSVVPQHLVGGARRLVHGSQSVVIYDTHDNPVLRDLAVKNATSG